jgi:hypothetical protein
MTPSARITSSAAAMPISSWTSRSAVSTGVSPSSIFPFAISQVVPLRRVTRISASFGPSFDHQRGMPPAETCSANPGRRLRRWRTSIDCAFHIEGPFRSNDTPSRRARDAST